MSDDIAERMRKIGGTALRSDGDIYRGQCLKEVELGTDKASQEMLDRFAGRVDEIPMIICGSGFVFRNLTPMKPAG
jgi:DNA-binding ferritin-like protein